MFARILYCDFWTRMATTGLPIIGWAMVMAHMTFRLYQGSDIDCVPDKDAAKEADLLRPKSTLPAFPLTGTMASNLHEADFGVQNKKLELVNNTNNYNRTKGEMDKINNRTKTEMEKLCWKQGTFVVLKGYETSMRDRLFYPAVEEFNPEEDKVVYQTYYDSNWVGMIIWGIIVSASNYIWKDCFAMRKIKGLFPTESPESPEELYYTMTQLFIETLEYHSNMEDEGEDATGNNQTETSCDWANILYCGLLNCLRPSYSNRTFGLLYLAHYFVSVLAPVSLYLYLSYGLIGERYATYGYDVIMYFFGKGIHSEWPGPVDILFPTVALCDDNPKTIGFLVPSTYVCKIPSNQLTRAMLFILWWVLAVVTLCVLIPFLRVLIAFLFPCYRHHNYRAFVHNFCKEEVNEAREYIETCRNGDSNERKLSVNTVIRVKLSFGDWVVLRLIRVNLGSAGFEKFICQLTATPNSAIYIRSAIEMSIRTPRSVVVIENLPTIGGIP